MLVLTRKIGETLIIGDDIRITVVSVGGGRVKIGIDAPRSVSVHREELLVDAKSSPEAHNKSDVVDQATSDLEPAVLINRLVDQFPPALASSSISLTETLPPVVHNRLAKYKRKPR